MDFENIQTAKRILFMRMDGYGLRDGSYLHRFSITLDKLGLL